MSEDDVHVRDGQDSHENADLIFYQAVNQGGGGCIDAHQPFLSARHPARKHPSRRLPAGSPSVNLA